MFWGYFLPMITIISITIIDRLYSKVKHPISDYIFIGMISMLPILNWVALLIEIWASIMRFIERDKVQEFLSRKM